MKRIIPPEDLPDKGIKYSRTQLWRKEREGTFPKRVQLGGNRVGYVESEIDAWIDALVAERDAKVGPCALKAK